jgi:para-nitrobenzyl esterase
MDAVVGTTAGRVRGAAGGSDGDRGFRFLGIPYAAPPVGPHRLLAPAPPEPWDGVRDALAYGPTSQRPEDEIVGGIPEPSIPGDDILTVNVFTPDPGGAGLPVLVWIHGGGFFAGSPASPWYDGDRFARDGVVVVTIGYRLGAEGFLALDGSPANRAVLDWIAALRWVQDNIAGFGGDPGRVTVGGQSAGAAAATTLMALVPGPAEGLFQRAVSMSGVAAATPLEDAHRMAAAVAERLGVAPTREAVAALPIDAFHAAQLALREEAEANAGLPSPDGSMGARMPYAPIVDGDLLGTKPLKAIAAGAGGTVDLLAGATHDEATLGVARRVGELGEVDETVLATLLTYLGLPAEDYRRLHRSRPAATVFGQAVTDRTFRGRVVSLAEARVAGGGAGRTYLYEFQWPSPVADGQLGAAHCLDIPFVFDNLDAAEVGDMAGAHPPQALADLMHRAWVRFVADGDPGWPAHDLADRTTMVFDVESGPVADLFAAERALWSRA